MLKRSLWMFAVLIVAGFLLVTVTLLKQGLPLSDPPGLWARTSVYLSANVAQTSVDASFKELQRVYLRGALPVVLARIKNACEQLGWEAVRVSMDKRRVEARVVSRWMKFTDDLSVQLQPTTTTSWALQIRSAARLGRADFGANERHILDLLKVLRERGLDVRSSP